MVAAEATASIAKIPTLPKKDHRMPSLHCKKREGSDKGEYLERPPPDSFHPREESAMMKGDDATGGFQQQVTSRNGISDFASWRLTPTKVKTLMLFYRRDDAINGTWNIRNLLGGKGKDRNLLGGKGKEWRAAVPTAPVPGPG